MVKKELLPRSRRPHRALSRFPTGVLCVVLAATGLEAENGDVLAISNLLSGTPLSDITFDQKNPVGGSLWALGERSGKIYNVSLDLSTKLGEINNPHGTGAFPNFILSRGIAYRPNTNTLHILAQESGVWKVREVRTNGAEVPEGAITITPPTDPADAALRGLAYDNLAQKFWYMDAENDKLVRMSLTGTAEVILDLPGDVPAETDIRGEGVGFELEQITVGVFEPRIYVAYGDIFRSNPSRLLQLTETGAVTGVEVPLTEVPVPDLRGFRTFRVGAQRRVAMVTGQGKMVLIEQVVPKPVPPSLLECSVTLTNKVSLSWQNNGSGASGDYSGEIVILRNGTPFITIPGNTTGFLDQTPLEGTSTYSLEASDTAGGALSPAGSECDVTVGTSGIVRWTPFPGAAPFDVARDPATGDIFATDSVGPDGIGRIYHFDQNLQLLGEVPSPWQRPGPIAFVPFMQIVMPDTSVITLQSILAVGRTDGVLVKLMDVTGAEKTTISLVGAGVVSSLTYIPATQQFAYLDQTDGAIHVTDKSGRTMRTCVPNQLFQLPAYDAGVTYDPIQDTFLTVFRPEPPEEPDLTVREIQTGGPCIPTDFQFTLRSLGEKSRDPGFLGGIEIAGNTLIAAGINSNAIFQVLIFPSGPPFSRGDFDRNGDVNLTDAVGIAEYLFKQGSPPICADSADSNDDGILDVSDPIQLLFYLFLSGDPPPAPFPGAGSDPTFRDNLGCDE